MLILEGENACIRVDEIKTADNQPTIRLVVFDAPFDDIRKHNNEGDDHKYKEVASVGLNSFDLGALTQTLKYIEQQRTEAT